MFFLYALAYQIEFSPLFLLVSPDLLQSLPALLRLQAASGCNKYQEIFIQEIGELWIFSND
ncbi:MAG: hypothetical protein ABS69_12790 [Nitrosomonadales bacterium SCN 54-20]|nr:MAG: hypothetical protein ABS69_12790 [Nitrosomonadales bacterium SCN 54-20]